jgi:hypothetical protein
MSTSVYVTGGYYADKVLVGEYSAQWLFGFWLDGHDFFLYHIRLQSPCPGVSAMASDDVGNVYVGFDAGGCIDKMGTYLPLSQMASGAGPTRGLVWRLTDRCLYSADYVDHQIIRVDQSGGVSVFAGSGSAGSDDGPVGLARFRSPMGVAISPDGARLYVADYGDGAVREIDFDQSTAVGPTSWGKLKVLYRP